MLINSLLFGYVIFNLYICGKLKNKMIIDRQVLNNTPTEKLVEIIDRINNSEINYNDLWWNNFCLYNGEFTKPTLSQLVDINNQLYIEIKDRLLNLSKNNNDIKYLGVPNICFSLIDGDDDREEKYSKQRIERGFDNSELWSLDVTICKFIIPRLKAFREIGGTYPANMEKEEWLNILDEMIWAFEFHLDDKFTFNTKKEEMEENFKRSKNGMQYFVDYFGGLWN